MRHGWWCEGDASDQRTPLEKQIQFTHRQRDRILTIIAPEARETTALEALRVQTEPRAVPVQRFRTHAIAAHEEKHIAVEWISLEALRHQGVETIKSSAHIRRLCVGIHRHAPAMPSHRSSSNSCAAVFTSSPS